VVRAEPDLLELLEGARLESEAEPGEQERGACHELAREAWVGRDDLIHWRLHFLTI